MRRFFSVFLAFLLLFGLASCANEKPVSSSESQTSSVFDTSSDISSDTSSETLSYPGETPGHDSSLPVLSSEASSSVPVSSEQVSSVPVSSVPVSSAAVSSAPVSSEPVSSVPASSEQASSVPVSSIPVSSIAVSSAAVSSASTSSKSTTSKGYSALNYNEVKAVWLSYLEIPNYLKGKTEREFRSIMAGIYENMVDSGFNTIYMQVRPFSDAIYESAYFPWSHVVTGTQGQAPSFDPLEVMIEEAHDAGISFHAWINPYRIKLSSNTFTLSDDNPAVEWMNGTAEEQNNVLTYNGSYYYNPASEDAQDLIINGVKELVKYYDVDGIHFDDYFYPTTDASFDTVSYNSYKKSGGTLSLDNWRRENVNTLVEDVYSAIKRINSTVLFGISPSGNINTNYSVYYADIAKWCSTGGYVDYICPQIYWGFEHVSAPFKTIADQWDNLVTSNSVDLIIGLAAYKIGVAETYASSTGKYEWQNSTEILSRMVTYSRSLDHYGGIAVYKYDSLFNPSSSVRSQVSDELSALEDVLLD